MSNGAFRRVSPAALVALALSLSACGTGTGGDDRTITGGGSTAFAAPAQQTSFGDFAAPAQTSPAPETPPAPQSSGSAVASGTDSPGPAHAVPVPGLGAQYSAQIPAETSQVLVVTSPDAKSETSTLSFFEFDDGDWHRLRTFETHNGSNGWLADRTEGDETTPIGVFTLSDAGGSKPDPGTKLPYTQDDRLPSSASVTYGPDYASVFDYIIAIDYNREPGTPPTDKTRPMGWEKGGGIWLHLDHDSGTHGCVTLEEADLKWILRTIDPKAHPRIVMGPKSELEK